MIFTNSQCRNKWLHRFSIIRQLPEGVQERCEICSKKVFFRIIDGKTDNKRYLSYHMRQALNPLHRLFEKEYGKISN